MLVLNETVDHMAMTNRVCWHGHALRALELEVEGQRKIQWSERT